MIREMARSAAESDTVRRRSWELWISALMCLVTLVIVYIGPRKLHPSDFPNGVTPLKNQGELRAIRKDVDEVKSDVQDVKSILQRSEAREIQGSIPPTWMSRRPPS